MTETVTRIEYTLPVNDPVAEDQVQLSRDDVWTGLVAKAADPRPYLAEPAGPGPRDSPRRRPLP